MEYLTGNQYFDLSAWDDRSFDSDARQNENKTMLNKQIIIGTDYLDFRDGQNESKRNEGTFWYFIYWFVLFVCSSDHNRTWTSVWSDLLIEN